MEVENTQLVVYDTPKAELKPYRNNYEVTIGNGYQCKLVRDVDFGKVPKAKSPSLWKSGAEKILLGFGLYYDVQITDSYKDYKTGFFYYECKAIAYHNGEIVRAGVGCANTSESSNGMASGFNQANSALKKAKKRAIVDLALTLGSLSDAFTQDIEDENNEARMQQLQSENDYINAKQVKRIFAIAASNEITTEKAKELLASWGYASTREIKLSDYDTICEKLENYNKE